MGKFAVRDPDREGFRYLQGGEGFALQWQRRGCRKGLSPGPSCCRARCSERMETPSHIPEIVDAMDRIVQRTQVCSPPHSPNAYESTRKPGASMLESKTYRRQRQFQSRGAPSRKRGPALVTDHGPLVMECTSLSPSFADAGGVRSSSVDFTKRGTRCPLLFPESEVSWRDAPRPLVARGRVGGVAGAFSRVGSTLGPPAEHSRLAALGGGRG